MAATASIGDVAARDAEYQLTDQQVRYFETFGFLRIPGLFADEIGEITAGFDDVFGTKALLEYLGLVEEPTPWFETAFDLHFGRRRITVPSITDYSERLRFLEDDPRVLSIVRRLVGPDFERCPADGNLFFCDTSWHHDQFGAPMKQFHLKLSFYLEPLAASSGAIRVLPGTNFAFAPFARNVRNDLASPDACREAYGIEPDEVPSYAIESVPGDMVLWNYRTVHASFGGGPGRRLLSLNYRAPLPPEEG
jgi:hypothetical protein